MRRMSHPFRGNAADGQTRFPASEHRHLSGIRGARAIPTIPAGMLIQPAVDAPRIVKRGEFRMRAPTSTHNLLLRSVKVGLVGT